MSGGAQKINPLIKINTGDYTRCWGFQGNNCCNYIELRFFYCNEDCKMIHQYWKREDIKEKKRNNRVKCDICNKELHHAYITKHRENIHCIY